MTTTQDKLNKDLFKAISKNNRRLVKDLIARGADVNFTQNDLSYELCTCLFKSISEGYIEIAKILIDAGADVNAPSYRFYDKTIPSYLISAALCSSDNNNTVPAVKLITMYSTNLATQCGNDALVVVSGSSNNGDYKEQLACCKELLKSNIDVNYVSISGEDALFRASVSGNIGIAKLLIEHGAQKNLASCFALDDYAPVESILKEKKGLVNHEAYVMYWAAAYNNISVLEKMVKYGFSLNTYVVNDYKKVCIPLGGAVNPSTKEWLLKNGATMKFFMDSTPNVLCNAAAGFETIDEFKELLELGANPNERWRDHTKATALHAAVSSWWPSSKKTKLLLEAGADVHAVDLLKKSAIHYAVERTEVSRKDSQETLDIINLLSDNGISTNAIDLIGNTPLHIAAMNGHGPAILERLIELNNDINQKNLYGETPLTLAATNNRELSAKYLLSKGAKLDLTSSICLDKPSIILKKLKDTDSIDISDSAFNTLLHYAVTRGSLSIIKILIEKGVMLNAFNKFNSTALDIAQSKDPKEMKETIEYLELKGAKLYKDLSIKNYNSICAYWIPKKDGEIIINYTLEGDLKNTYKQAFGFYQALEVTKEQRHLILKVFDYISSIFKIKFLETDNNGKVDLIVGQSLDELAYEVELEKEDHYISRAFITINRYDLNDSKIKYYPNYCFAKILKCLGRVLGIPLSKYTPSNISVISFLEAGLPDKEYNTQFFERDILNLSSRYNFTKDKPTQVLKPKLQNSYNIDDIALLNKAIKDNNVPQVKQLIANGIDINTPLKLKEGDILYPLSEAILSKNWQMINLLIDNGAKVNIVRNKFNTILKDACCTGEINIVNLLLKSGADPNLYGSINSNEIGVPLFTAIEKKYTNICKALIDAGANTMMELRSWRDRSIASMAAIYGNVDIVKLFYKDDTKIDLVTAFILDKPDRIAEIIKEKNISKKSLEYLLEEAIDKNNLALVNALLKFKVEACISNLYAAVKDDRIELVDALAPHIANINQYISQETVLHFAARYKKEEMISILLKHGADPTLTNKDLYDALHLVMLNNNYINLSSITKYAPNINAIDKNGNTALHFAASSKYFARHAETLTFLGANVNARNKDNKTVLHLAIQNDCDGWIVELFNNFKGDLNPQLSDTSYFSYIDFALDCSNYKIIPSLLMHGVKYSLISAIKLDLRDKAHKMLSKDIEVFSLDCDENTPLHIAAKKGYFDLVTGLISKGVKLNALNKRKQTALDMVKEAFAYDQSCPMITYLTSIGALTGAEIIRLEKLKESNHQSEISTSNVIDFFTRKIFH